MWTATYILSIVLVNWLFVVVPPLATPVGDLNLATLVVGAVFVLRDYAQREVGHKVLAATFVAGVITWFMTSPELAIASLTAILDLAPDGTLRGAGTVRTARKLFDGMVFPGPSR